MNFVPYSASQATEEHQLSVLPGNLGVASPNYVTCPKMCRLSPSQAVCLLSSELSSGKEHLTCPSCLIHMLSRCFNSLSFIGFQHLECRRFHIHRKQTHNTPLTICQHILPFPVWPHLLKLNSTLCISEPALELLWS